LATPVDLGSSDEILRWRPLKVAGSAPWFGDTSSLNYMPQPIKVVVLGMYRSGSNRIYNIIREATERHAPDVRVGHFGDVDELDLAVSKDTPFVFKEHDIGPGLADRIRSGEVKALGTLRDPLPSVVSLSSTFSWTTENVLDLTDRAVRTLEDLQGFVQLRTFEECISASPVKIAQIVRALDVPISLPIACHLAYRWRRKRLVQLSKEAELNSEMGPDAATIIHPDHVGGRRVLPESNMLELEAGIDVLHLAERVRLLRENMR